MLLSIPGTTSDTVDQYIAQRDFALAHGQPAPVFTQGRAYSSGYTMVASVRSEARLDDGTVFAREAVALLRPTPRSVVTFVAWRESDGRRRRPVGTDPGERFAARAAQLMAATSISGRRAPDAGVAPEGQGVLALVDRAS